jgi:hypothetical protein
VSSRRRGPVSRRWWALVAVGLATFMTYLDTTHTA